MPVTLQCGEDFPVAEARVVDLWNVVGEKRNFSDDSVVVKCVDEIEMRRLNLKFRDKDRPTNVLTFSYPGIDSEDGDSGLPSHDIAICLAVAKKEATEHGIDIIDYVAMLLVHAFLHATGMDHEISVNEASEMNELELLILSEAGFNGDAFIQ